MYRCPICAAPLARDGRTYRCENRHCYDISKRGYVNLLPPKGTVPGDNREMVLARRDFLSADYYAPFRDAVIERLNFASKGMGRKLETLSILDAGCGEGYYTSKIPAEKVRGADISREAVDYACRRESESEDLKYCVASVFNLPYLDESFHGAVSLFSPICADELARVLCPDGFVLVGAPGRDHLHELKEAVYDTPYDNDEIPPILNGFILTHTKSVEFTMNINSPEHIKALFSMTPYAYRTPAEGVARLNAIDSLAVTAHFALYLYKRN